jgi:hypothetical protein
MYLHYNNDICTCTASSGNAFESIGKEGESTMCQWNVLSFAA